MKTSTVEELARLRYLFIAAGAEEAAAAAEEILRGDQPNRKGFDEANTQAAGSHPGGQPTAEPQHLEDIIKTLIKGGEDAAQANFGLCKDDRGIERQSEEIGKIARGGAHR